jgi:hypothetical protein
MARAGARALIVVVTIFATATAAPPLAAQSTSSAGATRTDKAAPVDSSGTVLETDLNRLRLKLATGGSLKLELPQDDPTFRVDVEAKLPSIETWLGDLKALHRGPITAPAYHAEFLDMVTPREATASFTSGELLQVLVTGLLGGLAGRALTGAVKNAVASARDERACGEVRTTLIDLNRERIAAGLDPVPVPMC